MSGFPDPIRPYWPKVTGRRLELMVISEPTHWVSHWDVGLRRARRCGGPGCAMCAAGYQKQLRVVLLCLDTQGRDALLELRERHREKLDGYETTVGLRISLRRAGQAGNAPIDLEVLGEERAVARDIGLLVKSFGLEPIMGDVAKALGGVAELVEDGSERWA